jgi:uncharacterized protein
VTVRGYVVNCSAVAWLGRHEILHADMPARRGPERMILFGFVGVPYVLSGFAVGFVVGMTGVGGGSLMTPLLVLLFGLHPVTAVGTDLLYAAITKACGTAVHHIGRTIDWRVVARLAAGSLPACLATLAVLRPPGASGGAEASLIAHVLGGALLVTTLSLVFRRHVLAVAHRLSFYRRPHLQAAATVLLGAAIGALVTLSSVGAGAIGVTALVLLYPHLPIARIVGTDIAHAVPLTLLAGLGHLAIGTVDLALLASLLIGSVPGIALGSLLAPRVPERALRFLLAAVLAIVGARLVAR